MRSASHPFLQPIPYEYRRVALSLLGGSESTSAMSSSIFAGLVSIFESSSSTSWLSLESLMVFVVLAGIDIIFPLQLEYFMVLSC